MLPRIYISGAVIYLWDVCLYLSFLAVVAAAVVLRPKDFPLKRIQIFWLALLFILSGYIGSKLLNIIINAARYRGYSALNVFTVSGTAYLGAPILGFIVLWIVCRNLSVNFFAVADYTASILMLERIIGRLGCFFHGCCYGTVSSMPWAHKFYLFGQKLRHPTQIYALICALAVFASGRYLYNKTRSNYGVSFFYVILSYSLLRFFNEFFRAEGPFFARPIKYSHLGLLLIIVVSVISLFIIIKKSAEKKEIIENLKQAFTRLFLLILLVGTIFLLVLSLIPK
jgi:phosphatidylglycerol---prolipoprotein diacylglyceryl transferase